MKKLSQKSDVLIDAFRPGVMERFHLGPTELLADNPKLIYARMTGFGQTGPLSQKAGHDINYLAVSGMLSFLGRHNEKPTPPLNLLAGFAGGGLLCAFGICAALVERNESGLGQIVDSSLTEGAAYVGSWLTRSQHLSDIWGKGRGKNVLDGGRFYNDTYETSDGKFMSVGAIEAKFYQQFINGIGMENLPQFGNNEVKAKLVTNIFYTKTQAEWIDIYKELDACVFPVLDWKMADKNEHNKFRKSFVDRSMTMDQVVPTPAPLLSRTSASSGVLHRKSSSENCNDIYEMFQDINVDDDEINELRKSGVISIDD